MLKLFILLSMCVIFTLAAPGYLHSSPILTSTSYHSLPSVHVVHPIWSSHSIVRPIVHGGYGHGHGYGHGYGWI